MRKSKTIKNAITISGTYGDKTRLILDGYVTTKYGDIYKIKSVDQEKGYVYLYGCGDGGYDYSRISQSTTKASGNKSYLESLGFYFERHKIKENSIIKFRFSETSPIETYNVKKIIYPSLIEEEMDFVPKLLLENVENGDTFEIALKDMDDFARVSLVEVVYTPYTLKEKISNHLSLNSNFSGEIKDKDKYIEGLLELIKNEPV